MGNKLPSLSPHREAFLDGLAAYGVVSHAHKLSGRPLDRAAWYRLRDAEPEFAAAWEQALEASADRLEMAAYQRAVEGVDDPVFHQGVLAGYRRVYSDRLLETLLKGNRAWKYRDRIDHKLSGGVVQLVIETTIAPEEIEHEAIEGETVEPEPELLR